MLSLKELLNPLEPINGAKHCDILFLLLVVSVIFLILALLSFGMSIFDKKMSIMIASFVVIQAFLMHYLYRVFYSMCLKTM